MLHGHMGFADDFLQALKKAHKEKFGGVDLRLAEASDFDPTGLGRFLKKTDHKWLSSIGRLADACGLKIANEETAHSPEYAFIPKALARPAAGGGSLETSGEIDGTLAFKREWLTTKTVTSPEHLKVMEVQGDSMYPTIDNGDVVLVDEGDQAKELKEGRVYVIRKGDEIYVKRFQKGVGKLLFLGDNRDRHYQDVEVIPGDEDGFAVIGRVLWAGKEL